MQKTCIIIAGPTAVGKTALAIEVALHFNTEIISADSRQCYHEMCIGVARPNPEELRAVPHHFIDCISIQEEFTAGDYERFSIETLSEIFKTKDTAVVCGGTGLYLRAFTQGLDDIPTFSASIRKEIEEAYADKGIEWLQQTLAASDPLFAGQGAMQNPNRMMRALEVIRGTGKSILEFQTGIKKPRPFRILQYGLEMPRDLLYERINTRVDQMMEAGLLEEARGLIPFKHLPALQTVGYRELFDYFSGLIDLPRAIAQIKQNTRHYAKRQITWFKKVEAMKFCAAEKKSLMHAIQEDLNSGFSTK